MTNLNTNNINRKNTLYKLKIVFSFLLSANIKSLVIPSSYAYNITLVSL